MKDHAVAWWNSEDLDVEITIDSDSQLCGEIVLPDLYANHSLNLYCKASCK